ncbi:TIGR03086 family protein [Actinoalloteichus sp. AHMU CJ021]|uniref:TIGR03086 family protein n=2 Tax=Actinoalloteichus cyanogriseus TaxID=2893586 RepID=A0ABT1JBZ5_ACTCY|nr:TIGR03086 family metal-binding protein [Actinoalloteichus caeruleus]AUS80639.1 TIGR03086 family protein [Actinoalloteichus sp. AHMU CJ021]MCP2330021.1 TIGR03086 family protein [Actinoalloteichus caeruleus DSM 43889]
MDLLTAHGRAMAEFDRRVRQVTPDQWTNATPCTEWTVRDLVNHIVTEQRWAPVLLSGATVAEVGDRFDGDQLGPDPVASWAEASAAAREAFRRPGVLEGRVSVSSGYLPASEYGWQMTSDLAIHAWDLAKGIGVDTTLDSGLVEAVDDVIRPEIDDWDAAGIYAPPVPVSQASDPQAQLLGLVGRHP